MMLFWSVIVAWHINGLTTVVLFCWLSYFTLQYAFIAMKAFDPQCNTTATRYTCSVS